MSSAPLPKQFPAVHKNSLENLTKILACQKQQQTLAATLPGPYQLLLAMPDTTLLKKLQEERLGSLFAYDACHHTQFAETLRLYLLHSCSLQATAQAIFAHRNTIHYRIGKIKEILNCDFDDAALRFELLLAFYINDYLKKLEEQKKAATYTRIHE